MWYGPGRDGYPLPVSTEDLPMSTNSPRTYTVTGMTCDHCVRSVREEVSEVAGVRDVGVELASGRLTVAGEGFSDDAVRAAVAEAGYEVTA
jgi:copper chaperone CopZ